METTLLIFLGSLYSWAKGADSAHMRKFWRLLLFISLGLVLVQSEDSTQGQVLTRIQEALGRISQVSTGSELIQKAENRWKQKTVHGLMSHFAWGDASRTDTVLTRHYNPFTGIEEQEREVTVYLREDQSEVELALDLAHELVHATAHPSFDPYDSNLTPAKYIQSALEGEGGEVSAVITECQIAYELSVRFKVSISRCQEYLRSTLGQNKKEVDREKVRRDFYRVGKWREALTKNLGLEARLFPLLSNDTPKFYSSTGHAPYPFVLFQEFREITELACDNTRKRMKSVATQEIPSKAAAIQSGSFIQKRCLAVSLR